MATVMVTLLKRTDCACWKLHIGTGAAEAALALSSGHCFSVQPLISFPNAPQNAPDEFNAFVLEHTLPLENNWFYLEHTSVERAVAKLVTICCGFQTVHSGTSDNTQHIQSPSTEATKQSSETLVESLPDQGSTYMASTRDHVEFCEGKDADKAANVRAYLQRAVGSEQAAHIIAGLNTSSTRDRCGHKQGFFVLDGKPIRLLKPAG